MDTQNYTEQFYFFFIFHVVSEWENCVWGFMGKRLFEAYKLQQCKLFERYDALQREQG